MNCIDRSDFYWNHFKIRAIEMINSKWSILKQIFKQLHAMSDWNDAKKNKQITFALKNWIQNTRWCHSLTYFFKHVYFTWSNPVEPIMLDVSIKVFCFSWLFVSDFFSCVSFVSMICVSHFKTTGRQTSNVCQLSKYSVKKCKYAWNILMSLLKKHARFECQKNMLVI